MFLLCGTLFCTILTAGCKKNFLDDKPSTAILQPATLDEFQGLLDNMDVINTGSALATLAADEYEFDSYEVWQSARTATERNSYVWARDLYAGEVNDAGDWNRPYASIFYANNVLAGLEKIPVNSSNNNQWRQIKGWALFVRAYNYYELVRNFSPVYNQATASADLGVPLRLKPSIDVNLARASVQQTFDQIFTDLQQASALLAKNLPFANRNRPSKIAAQALFARIYLNMRNYAQAELHADSTLNLYNKLIDYNTVSTDTYTPFETTNDENIYSYTSHNYYYTCAGLFNPYTTIAPEVLNLYDSKDLRPAIYFLKQDDGTVVTKRNYFGASNYPFTGLATDEVYLIKAECAARRNDAVTAVTYLNNLLIKRYPTDQYIPLVASSAQQALAQVLLERRKELVWRGLRWDDLKRLNKEGANITLTHQLDGKTYTLPPNDPRYVFPIPDNEILLSGIEQNQR